MANARFLSTRYDNVVMRSELPMASLNGASFEAHRKPVSQTISVHILAERPDLRSAAAAILSELGFMVVSGREALRSADLDRGLLMIVGDRFAPNFLAEVLIGPWTSHLERVILFGSRIDTSTLAALDQVGFPLIVKSLPTLEHLTSLLTASHPALLATGRSVLAKRTEASAAIEAGSNRLFEHIRAGNLGAAVSEAKSAFNYFEALLDSAAAAHWLSIIQAYHDGTSQHCSLVSAIAMLFARGLGFSENDQRRLFEAAHFHDVGKVNVPLNILDKPGALEPDERTIMEMHARAGYDILAFHDAIAREAAEVARDHHEYLDGTGYPRGIGGRQISDITRIITICDIFAALIERRSYKQPRTAAEAYSILQSLQGKLDPTLLRSFSGIAQSCSPG